MKTILVDAVECFVSAEGVMFQEMYELLETYKNKKILMTGADDEGLKKYNLDKAPYEVFTLKHNPEKTDPEYYKIFLSRSGLRVEDVVYFEHGTGAVKSAQSVGINTYYYDSSKKDLIGLRDFLDKNLS